MAIQSAPSRAQYVLSWVSSRRVVVCDWMQVPRRCCWNRRFVTFKLASRCRRVLPRQSGLVLRAHRARPFASP